MGNDRHVDLDQAAGPVVKLVQCGGGQAAFIWPGQWDKASSRGYVILEVWAMLGYCFTKCGIALELGRREEGGTLTHTCNCLLDRP